MTFERKPTPTRYYTCVNCGHAGDYKFVRFTQLNCESCGYDEVSDQTEEDIKAHSGLRIKFEGIINMGDSVSTESP